MARPEGGYKLKDGTPVPGCSTIAGKFKDSGGLIHWAWKLGMEGKDYRKVRDDAATAGTMAHAAVEAWIRKKPFEWVGEPEVVARAKKSYGAFLEWAQQTRLTVTESEVTLISERHRVGGTLDAVVIGGKRAIADWKTADAVYPENLIQLRGYGELWNEAHPEEPAEGYHLIRFDKQYGDLHTHWWAELDAAWEAFRHLRALYDIEKELKARAK